MSSFNPLLDRNPQRAAAGGLVGLSPMPTHQVFVVSCLDARTDPAHYLGLEPGEALVLRNAGGRVTPEVIEEVAFIAAVTEFMLGEDAPDFEVAVVHHTGCGTGLLADPTFRAGFAGRIDRNENDLAEMAVLDPTQTVTHDVGLLRSSPLIPDRATATGHVYDVDTGLLTTIVPAD
jgi:carbonic anhydrase